MHLTPREQEKLLVYTLADVALRRKAKGLKLNHPESVAVISAAAMEGAREGKTVEQVMKDAAEVLTLGDVMQGVADMIPFVQVEAVFTGQVRGGCRPARPRCRRQRAPWPRWVRPGRQCGVGSRSRRGARGGR